MEEIKNINLNLNQDDNHQSTSQNQNNGFINPLKRVSNENQNYYSDTVEIHNISKNGFENNLNEFEFDEINSEINIKVIGLGGAGNNMIAHIAETTKINLRNLYALNTDFPFLKKLPDSFARFLIGKVATKGRGSGSNPAVGRESAIEDIELIKKILKDTDLLFIVSGMGKGTGTGASPIVAQVAKEMGILTLCLVNVPSIMAEGNIVYQKGLSGLNELKKYADGICIISNEKIIDNNFLKNNEQISIKKSFELANDVISNTIEEISTIVNVPAQINIDFNDIKNFFSTQLEFQLDTFNISSNENIEAVIKSKIESQIYERQIKNIDRVLIDFTLNESVPQNIISSFRQAYENVVDNSEFSLNYSINYDNNIEFANVSVLIGSKLNDETNEVQSSINKVNKVINDEIKAYNSNFIDNPLKENKHQVNQFNNIVNDNELLDLLKEDEVNQNVKNIYIQTSNLNKKVEPESESNNINFDLYNENKKEFSDLYNDIAQLNTQTNQENIVDDNNEYDIEKELDKISSNYSNAVEKNNLFNSTSLNNFFKNTIQLSSNNKNKDFNRE